MIFLLPSVLFIFLAFGLSYFLTQALPPRARLFILALVPVAALSIYLLVGSPTLAGRPQAALLAEQLADGNFNPHALTALIENKLSQSPNHYDGWQTLGVIHLDLEHFYQAEEAFVRANKIKPNQTATLLGIAQAKFYANDTFINQKTLRLVRRVLKLEPDNLAARFLLAQAQLQDGKKAAARATLRRALRAATRQKNNKAQQLLRETLDKIKN